MPIDWFTIAAQIANFIVLVWVLKRFLYRPVLKVMDERQKRVEESMLSATREKGDAAKERAGFEEKSRKLESEREATLAAAAGDAESERARVVAEAREEYQAQRERWRKTLRDEQDDLTQELAKRVQHEILAVAGQLTRDLAGADLQKLIACKFIRKLEEMPAAERKLLAPDDDDDENGHDAVVRSAFEFPSGLRDEIERAARGVIGGETPLRFETKPTLGAGIELAANGRKAGWTIDHYLNSLEAGVKELIERETGPHEAKPE